MRRAERAAQNIRLYTPRRTQKSGEKKTESGVGADLGGTCLGKSSKAETLKC